MKRPQKGKVGGYIPRTWYANAMKVWAKRVREVERQKNIEIKELKEKIRDLSNQLKEKK